MMRIIIIMMSRYYIELIIMMSQSDVLLHSSNQRVSSILCVSVNYI